MGIHIHFHPAEAKDAGHAITAEIPPKKLTTNSEDTRVPYDIVTASAGKGQGVF